jgi:GABA permease
MGHILLVANQTATSEPLFNAVRDRIAEGSCEFTLVMPITSAGDVTHSPARFVEGGGWADVGRSDSRATPDDRFRVARQRLDDALGRLRELGASVTGEVGQEDPFAAVVEMTKRHKFDEIIISTLPRRVSRWLRQDVPSRVERKTRLPVTVVSQA